jgi:hypothetical protein
MKRAKKKKTLEEEHRKGISPISGRGHRENSEESEE